MGYSGATMSRLNTAPAVSIQQLCHDYGQRKALIDVSFDIPAGTFLALLGPNGAGKTTLFSLLTRLLRPSSGSIQVFGADLARSPGAALARMGVVFQQPTLDLDLTLRQNLAYHGAIQGLSPKHVKRRSQAELERFELWARCNERVRDLNGGHRRRVEIARALLHEPDLLLLDEASAGLDLESRTHLYQHVRNLCRDEGKTVLWTTHLVEELNADELAVLLQRGQVKGQGALSALAAAQGHEDANALVLSLSEPAS